ncbi:MAG: zinc-finger domain-containing protein [Pseudomonadota bacterium]
MTPDAPEIEEVTARKIHCDGREGPLGHPRVYLSIPESGFIDCPYCDKRFVLKPGGGGH